MEGRFANVSTIRDHDWYLNHVSDRTPVSRNEYIFEGYGSVSQYSNNYVGYDDAECRNSTPLDEWEARYLGLVFHHVTVEKDYEDDHARHKRMTLALAQAQYADDENDIDYKREYAQILNHFDVEYVQERKKDIDCYCPIRRDEHHFGVFGDLESAVLHMEAPNIPFIDTDCLDDYTDIMVKIMSRYPSISDRNAMAYVNMCHRTLSDLVDRGYFDIGKAKFTKVVRRCMYAIRATGKVPNVASMLSPNFNTWIDKYRLPKGDKTGEFVWNYMFHFTLMYHPKVKQNKRFNMLLEALVRARVDAANGHMFEKEFKSMLNNGLKGIEPEAYDEVATKLIAAMKTQVAESLTGGIDPDLLSAAKIFMTVVGGLVITTLVLFCVRYILGECHAFVMFLKNLIFPELTRKQWRQTELEDTEKQATGHMWENIKPLCVRFGIMLVQVITGAPTNAREVSECLRTINYGSSFIETILTNVEPLFRMAACKITGDKMWIQADMDDDIMEHIANIEELRAIPNLHMRLGNDLDLCKRVKSSYHWHTQNLASLRSAGIRDKTLGVILGRAERDLYKWYETAVDATNNADSRLVPISIMLSGPVNQGKTSMIEAIVKIVHAFFQKHGKYENDAQKYFSKAKDSEYWDGYNHQITYIVDEFLASALPEDRNAQLMELLGVINNGVYPLNFADCKSKGKDVFDSPLVIYTSNYTRWKEIQMTDPEALFKRIHFPLELRRGTTIKSGVDIPTAWEVTLTQHALDNKALYAGTPQRFWDTVVEQKDSKDTRKWISFAVFMDMILAEYTERLSAKPLTNHMGDVQTYCANLFPKYFADGETEEGSLFCDFQERLEDGTDDGTNSLIYENVSEEDFLDKYLPSVDGESSMGHMFSLWASSGNDDNSSSTLRGLSSSTKSSSASGYFSHYTSVEIDPLEDVEVSETFEEALQKACDVLGADAFQTFLQLYKSVQDEATSFAAQLHNGGHLIPPCYREGYRYMLTAHKVFFCVCRDTAQLKKEWMDQVYPALHCVANSLDGTLLPRMFPKQFDALIQEYYTFITHDDGIVLGAKALTYCSTNVEQYAREHPANHILWNAGGFHVGARRHNHGQDDICQELHKHHVCGAFFSGDGPDVPRFKRKVNDFCAVMTCVAKHITTTTTQFTSTLMTHIKTAATPLYHALAQRMPGIMIYVGSMLASLAFVALVAGVSTLIQNVVNKYSSGHSETHKNPMLFRKGRDKDTPTKYCATGHQMHQQDAQLAAVTTRNSITRHFLISFKTGEEVRGKCIALGKYLFFHSHVLWAFGDIATLTVCNDPKIQVNGSQTFYPRDFVIRDYMEDAYNKRDMVRLEFVSKYNYLGKKPDTYLVSQRKWDKQLKSEALIRVMGAGDNRKISIPHVVKDVFRIGRPYGTKIEVEGAVHIRDHEAGYMAYDTPSLPGDCSDPYISGVMLLGLHVGYANGDSVFMPIYLEDCEDSVGIAHMNYVPRVVATDLYMPPGVLPLGMVSKDMTGRPVDPYVSTIYGPRGHDGVGGYRPAVFPLARVPSPLTGLPGQSPWSKHNNNYSRTHSPPVPVSYMVHINKDPAYYVRPFFTVPSDVRCRRLTDEEVDNGIPGYLVGVDVSTSPGLLGKVYGKNRDQLYLRDSDGKLRPGPELVDAANDIADKIRNNTIPMVMCCENLKAETIPPNKLPRCFTGVSIEHLRWTKAVVGDALGYMKKHVVGSACSVGVNPHSHQWAMLHAEFVDGFGDEGNIIAGDLSNCDLSCHPIFVGAMVAFLNMFYKYDQNSESFRELEFCCLSIINQARLRGKRLFEIFRGHPSGHYLTTLFNCVVIFTIHRYAYTELVDVNEYPWHENVRLKVYGDDSLGCVHDRVKDWYNMRTIQPFFAMFGMIYTDPAKREDFPPFIAREDANFLGRGFRPTPTMMCAPLNLDAIYGMVHWVRTESLTVDVALDTNIKCALMEMYHHGEEAFVKFRNLLYLEGIKRDYVSQSLVGPYDYAYFYEYHCKCYTNCDDICSFNTDALTDMFFC
jgi:hypothetical protein